MTLIPRQIALLLDVDGTLLDLAPRPELVVVDDGLRTLLGALQSRLDGALALVSGRPIEAIDGLFAPFSSAAIGLHGMELRSAPGKPVVVPVDHAPPQPLAEAVARLAAGTPGAFIEDKSRCIALHHRLDERARLPLREAMQRAIDEHAPGWDMIDGHQVFEVKPASVNKGSASLALLGHAPFRGRLPVYLGDDTTDLDAFAAVTAAGGRAIAVGPRVADRAPMRLPSPAAARDWLGRLADTLVAAPCAVDALLESG